MKEDGNEITVCLIEWSWNKIILVCSTFKELLPQMRVYVQNIKLKIPNALEIGFNLLIENLRDLEELVWTDSNWKSKLRSYGDWEAVRAELLNSERVFVSLSQLLSIA